jgi:hypothetical protein
MIWSVESSNRDDPNRGHGHLDTHRSGIATDAARSHREVWTGALGAEPIEGICLARRIVDTHDLSLDRIVDPVIW